MLTQDEKTHLRDEEDYRRLVQEEFAKSRKKTPWQQFLAFFESSFGKWVLTSILATFVTLMVTAAHDSLNSDRIAREAAESRARVDAELVAKLLPLLKDYCEPTGLTAFAVLNELSKKGINEGLAGGIKRSTERFLRRSQADDGKPIAPMCHADIAAISEREDLDLRQASADKLANITPTKSADQQLTVAAPAQVADSGVSLFGLGGVAMKRPITESVASLRGVAPRVYLQIQRDGDQEPLAKALMATLQEEKFLLPGIERLPISKMPAKPQVRYFSNDDREAALRVVEAARKAIPSLSFEAVRVTNLPAPAGTLEVWFSRQG